MSHISNDSVSYSDEQDECCQQFTQEIDTSIETIDNPVDNEEYPLKNPTSSNKILKNKGIYWMFAIILIIIFGSIIIFYLITRKNNAEVNEYTFQSNYILPDHITENKILKILFVNTKNGKVAKGGEGWSENKNTINSVAHVLETDEDSIYKFYGLGQKTADGTIVIPASKLEIQFNRKFNFKTRTHDSVRFRIKSTNFSQIDQTFKAVPVESVISNDFITNILVSSSINNYEGKAIQGKKVDIEKCMELYNNTGIPMEIFENNGKDVICIDHGENFIGKGHSGTALWARTKNSLIPCGSLSQGPSSFHKIKLPYIYFRNSKYFC